MGNSIIFEAPARSYSAVTYQHILEMVPTHRGTPIPCLYIAPDPSTQVLLLYFHGNAEDNGLCFNFAYSLHEKFKVDIMMVEYPGYGIYAGEPSEQAIYEDANTVLGYVTGPYGCRKTYRRENVIVVGRSLGSAPALELASKYFDLGGVILLAPFTSIRDVADNKSWALAFVTPFIASIFNNESRAARVTIPILLVHGTADTVVPHHHSERLARVCRSPYKVVKFIDGMTHNGFNLERDLLPALSEFFKAYIPQISSASTAPKYYSHRPPFPGQNHSDPPLGRTYTDNSPRKFASQAPYQKSEVTGFPSGPGGSMFQMGQSQYPSHKNFEASPRSGKMYHQPSVTQSQISMGRPAPSQAAPVNGINVRYYGSTFGAPPQPSMQNSQSMRGSDCLKSAFYC